MMNKDEAFDERKLKEILKNFDRRFQENQKLRAKWCDDPAKFASSETELYVSLDELQSITTHPELYKHLFNKTYFQLLTNSLLHENNDVSAKVVSFLQELIDLDELIDPETIAALKQCVEENHVLKMVIANISRFDENVKEDAQAINNSLEIVENLVDLDEKNSSNSAIKSLIEWMVKKLDVDAFTEIKVSISEVLSILTMTNDDNKNQLGKLGAIDVLLRQVAKYRAIAPQTGDEHEYMEQIIVCLETSMFNYDPNKLIFIKEEGVDLVELVLRDKRDAVKQSNIKSSLLKMFSYVLTTDKDPDPIVQTCCDRFVKVLGLRVMFPIFQNPKVIFSKKLKKKDHDQMAEQIEEHSASIILSLMKYCNDSDSIQRIAVKFAESSFEKFNRLVELHEKNFRRVSNLSEEDDTETEHCTLRVVDQIILRLCFLNNHFEIYDPTSGKTFTSYLKGLLTKRPELRHQLMLEIGSYIESIEDESNIERKTLTLLVEYFDNHILKELSQSCAAK